MSSVRRQRKPSDRAVEALSNQMKMGGTSGSGSVEVSMGLRGVSSLASNCPKNAEQQQMEFFIDKQAIRCRAKHASMRKKRVFLFFCRPDGRPYTSPYGVKKVEQCLGSCVWFLLPSS